MADPNPRLRAVLTECRWTYDQAARSVNAVAAEHGVELSTSKSTVTHWLSGREPRNSTAAFLAEAVSRRLGRTVAPGELGYHGATIVDQPTGENALDALTQLGMADVDRRDFLATTAFSLGAITGPLSEARPRALHAARTGRPVGMADVESASQVARIFDSIDERHGGGTGRETVSAFLAHDVAALCHAATGPVRQAMFTVATELAFLAGWKNHDLRREGAAQRFYLHANALASELTDPTWRAMVLRILAHQAFDLGHGTGCLDLAEEAHRLVTGRVDPHTQGVFMLTIARAHAMTGDPSRALAALGAAERLDDRSRDGDERPDWPKMRHNRGQFHSHTAHTLARLGDLVGAERHYFLGWKERDPRTHTLIAGLSQAWLAEVQIKQGKIGIACANWSEAFQTLDGIASERAAECRRDMRKLLAPHSRRRIPEVNQLLATYPAAGRTA